jgi:hypothetical protein
MQTLNELETAPIPLEEEEQRHSRRLFVGVLCALILTAIVFGGYFYLRKRHDSEIASAAAAAPKPKTVAPPKVEVFVDDAMIKDKQIVLGGTVHNISTEGLRNVSVELLLRRRVGAGVEAKVLPLDAPDLAPDGKGNYSLTISAKDYMTAVVDRVFSGDSRTEVPFKSVPGAQRPPEAPPTGKTIIQKRAPRGEEFINTPDKPERIPK